MQRSTEIEVVLILMYHPGLGIIPRAVRVVQLDPLPTDPAPGLLYSAPAQAVTIINHHQAEADLQVQIAETDKWAAVGNSIFRSSVTLQKLTFTEKLCLP